MATATAASGRGAATPPSTRTASERPPTERRRCPTATVYDPSTKSTAVTLSLRTNFADAYGNAAVIGLFGNDGPDGDGEQPIFSPDARNTSGDPFTVNIPGDWRGKWINATSSRVHFLDSLPPAAQSITPAYYAGGDTTTSELSNAVQVQ